jgi:transposase
MANSRMLAMAAAIALRSDFTGADLRRLARRTQDAKQARRLLSLATIYDGGSRSDAARIGDVGLQIIRDWVLRFNAAGPDGLVDRKAPGPEPRLNEDHRAALAAAIESGPIPAIHSVVRWRLVDLCQWLWEEFRVSIARQTLSRELRSLGYRKLTARPRHHAQTAGAIAHFRKVSRPSWQRSRRTNASSLPR